MISLLLDQGLPQSTSIILRSRGFNAIHVEELGMNLAEDSEIIAYAVTNHYVIVTLDSDFHALIAIASSSFPSTIQFRLQGMKAAEASRRIARALLQLGERLRQGCLATISERSTRIRLLPIATRNRPSG